MNPQSLLKVFQLEKYVLERIEYLEERIEIYCHARVRGMWYQERYSKKVCEVRRRGISHMVLEGKPVVLQVLQRRFVFPGTRRWEALPGVKKHRQCTETFRLNTLRELQRDNYSGTGKKRGKSAMYALKLLDDIDLEFEWKKPIRKIGIDGKAVRKHSVVHNITNLESNKPIGILPNLSGEDLKKNS